MRPGLPHLPQGVPKGLAEVFPVQLTRCPDTHGLPFWKHLGFLSGALFSWMITVETHSSVFYHNNPIPGSPDGK